MSKYGQLLDQRLASLGAKAAEQANLATAPCEERPLRVTVGLGTCGLATGAQAVHDILEQRSSARDLKIDLIPVGCQGRCYAEPIVEIYGDDSKVTLAVMDEEKTERLVDLLEREEPRMLRKLIDSGSFACEIGSDFPSLAQAVLDDDFKDDQTCRVMDDCGEIDPGSIEEYVIRGGYSAFLSALDADDPEGIVSAVEASGLRGRGGAGFPTGAKWRSMLASDDPERYVIVNADEGDPGAYMDRGLLEGDPHKVLEGLAIACFATGAHKAYFFIRAEYPIAVLTVQKAIDDAYELGLLGESVLDSGFSLDVSVVRGAGAFLCGESTAMVNVLEGKECTTRPKPPHLTERGLWGHPTCINNVETLANVPGIIGNGPEWFRSVGTSDSPGTKIFSVAGSVERGGLIEVPLGTPLSTILDKVARAENPKAIQIGGPSGALLPAALNDLSISYEGFDSVDAMMGSGGLVVLGQDQCIVDTAKYFAEFSNRQSCEKCALCRTSLDECSEILNRITTGHGTLDDLRSLRAIAHETANSKLCGLGRTALNPVSSSLRFFEEEYRAHIEKECPSLVCRDLVSYVILEDKCQGERCCLLTCPGNAIKGPFGKPGNIVPRLCQKCGMCMVTCPYGAVAKVSPAI